MENDIDVHEIFGIAQKAGFTRLSLKVATDMELSAEDHKTLFAPPHGPEHEHLRSELWNQTFNTQTNRSVFFLHKGPLARDSRSHIGLGHELTAHQTAFSGQAGRPIDMTFTLKNTGDATWLNVNDEIFGTVRLAAHLYDRNGTLLDVDFLRHGLPRAVNPGEVVVVTLPVVIPRAGAYRLRFDLVAEGVTWFETTGSRPASVDVTVEAS